MKVYCVPSHHALYYRPLEKQAVLLTQHMLDQGLWYEGGSRAHVQADAHEKMKTIYRSENESEYKVALQALHLTHNDYSHARIAVVAIRWCSLFGCLVLPKRAWLAIYLENVPEPLVTYSHGKDGRPFRTFLECLSAPSTDTREWQERFQADLKKAHSKAA